MAGGSYSSSVDDYGGASSGITNNLGGGINAPAIQKGSQMLPLILGAVALFAAIGVAVYVVTKKRG